LSIPVVQVRGLARVSHEATVDRSGTVPILRVSDAKRRTRMGRSPLPALPLPRPAPFCNTATRNISNGVAQVPFRPVRRKRLLYRWLRRPFGPRCVCLESGGRCTSRLFLWPSRPRLGACGNATPPRAAVPQRAAFWTAGTCHGFSPTRRAREYPISSRECPIMKYTRQPTASGTAVQAKKVGHPAKARLPVAAWCDALFAGGAGPQGDHERTKTRKALHLVSRRLSGEAQCGPHEGLALRLPPHFPYSSRSARGKVITRSVMSTKAGFRGPRAARRGCPDRCAVRALHRARVPGLRAGATSGPHPSA
jgi:hypothetical protein